MRFIMLILILLLTLPALAFDWYVAQTGTNTPNCGLPSEPCHTLDYLYPKTSEKDSIQLLPSAQPYAPLAFSITHSLTFWGSNGPVHIGCGGKNQSFLFHAVNTSYLDLGELIIGPCDTPGLTTIRATNVNEIHLTEITFQDHHQSGGFLIAEGNITRVGLDWVRGFNNSMIEEGKDYAPLISLQTHATHEGVVPVLFLQETYLYYNQGGISLDGFNLIEVAGGNWCSQETFGMIMNYPPKTSLKIECTMDGFPVITVKVNSEEKI